MLTVGDLTHALAGHLELVTGAAQRGVDDVVVLEGPVQSTGEPVGVAGDLVLGIGLLDPPAAAAAIDRLGERRVSAVLLRGRLADAPEVRAAAERAGVALIRLADHAAWAHTVWLLRGLLDRANAHGTIAPQEDLYALADSAARLLEGAVTIEDAQHRVLAYSSRQGVADPARVSTIVGRRVPVEVVRELRARGVFRRMAASDTAFFLEPGKSPELGGRFIVPVHAGGEWLGSIWAVLDAAPPERVGAQLTRMASTVAIHLLGLRSQTDLAHRVWVDRLRQSLLDPTADAAAWLPPGPWRVVGLGGAPDHRVVPAAAALEVWEAALRRRGWRQPTLADVAERVFAVVQEGPSGVGTRAWLETLIARFVEQGYPVTAAFGGRADQVADLPSSRGEAFEVMTLPAQHDPARRPRPVLTVEQAWAGLAIDRAERALRAAPVRSPLSDLPTEPVTERVTLRAWLEHPGDLRRVAEVLGVHPNTVRYRMERIGALLGVDLSDPASRLALQLLLRSEA